ncbi:MAG: hypothetical protein KDA84_21070, partial [Planctomycetaceae bacterium]|nr:hypothetical protein [Planctomycetaceae bacterium]
TSTSDGIRDLRKVRVPFANPNTPVVHLNVLPCSIGLCGAGGRYRRDFGKPLSISSRDFPK